MLGGGGSRGYAHAGALLGLERLGHDPGMVVGASIGALVGALYAAGYGPGEIQRLVREEDWNEVFTPAPLLVGPDREPRYPILAYDREVDSLRFNRGIVPQWRINRLLVRLLFDAEARSRGDFDRLARRFRAVATDLATGRPVVLSRGDLPRAARASMAVPGVFSPVEWEGRSLVDGGISNNLPVRPARDLGADFVIAVEVSRPEREIEGRGALQVLGRALDLLQENAQRGEPPPDVLVLPAIDPSVWGIGFAADPEPLFAAGLAAALRDAPPAARRRPGPRPLPAPPRAFGALRIEAPDSATARLARRVFRDVAPGAYDPRRVLSAVDRLYTTGLFEGVWPRVEDTESAEPTLVVRVEAQPTASLAGALGYDTDRGGRFWAAAQRSRPLFGAPGLLTASVSLDRLEQWGSASVRVFPVRLSPLVWSAGAYAKEMDLRRFGPEAAEGDVEVRRTGGWLGVDFQQLLAQRVASAVVRAEWVDVEEGEGGFSAGPLVRIASPRAEAPVVGVPLEIEGEARWGAVAYRRASARGSLGTELGPLKVAAVADGTVASRGAPADALPALGDERAVPGFRWGEARGRMRAVAGGDAAYPLPRLGGHLRTRLRAGWVGDALETIDEREGWVTGAELGALWSTPFGAIHLAFGANSRGDRRLVLDLGAPF